MAQALAGPRLPATASHWASLPVVGQPGTLALPQAPSRFVARQDHAGEKRR